MLNALRIAMPRQRRRTEAGQSLIAAIIVLFLLLVLGAAFVALVGNNLRNAKQTARRNASDFYSEAGIRFLDEQLTKSADGADWRPTPACLGTTLPCSDTNISTQDPDYFWLQPYNDNNTPNNLNDDVGGYTRITYGGDTPGSPGGRALVRVTYRPEVVATGTNPTVNPSVDAPVRKLIRLEAVGRVGVVTAGDPTTYNNSQQASLARELVAYKEIGITDYLRYFTNKDNKPTTATLGAAVQVYDAPDNGTGASRPATVPVVRDIESYFIGGGIRSNAALTFYGVNRLVMDPARGEGLMVAGQIALANVPGSVTQAQYPATKNGNPARVTLQTALTGAAANIFPSTSGDYNTYNGQVRDNPAGSDTQGLPRTTITGANMVESNLRSVPRAGAPVLDTQTASGVTRYRALTRDSAPLSTADAGGTAVTTANAGANGWGQNLYLSNRGDVQNTFSNVVNAYSLRTDWLNPGAGQSAGFWKKDFVYAPPGVTITLTPRYIVLTRSGDQLNPASAFIDRFRFRRPDGSLMRTEQSIIRYSYDNANGLGNAPTYNIGENVQATSRFAGYPVTYNNTDKCFDSDFVIYAEGNVRIRGVAGGFDPETAQYFRRHLTIVSGGTVYVDGNLLRDNIPSTDGSATAAAVRGQSSIALLAHDYVAVNTSQFLAPQSGSDIYSQNREENYAFSLSSNPGKQTFNFAMDRGPVDANNTPPSFMTTFPAGDPRNYPLPTIFFRHGTSGVSGAAGAPPTEGNTFVTLGLNSFGTAPAPPGVLFNFNGSTILELNNNTSTNPVFVDQAFSFQAQTTSLLYGPGMATPPFAAAQPTLPELGTPNQMTLSYDPSAANQSNAQNYFATRIGIAPLDVRIEAVMYAQEGSFFIIPGPWLNPNPEDTYEAYVSQDPANTANQNLKRPEDSSSDDATNPLKNRRVDPSFPFYRQPQDIRMTFFGAITENLPAEVGDQSAWLEKWGWVPRYQGATGLATDPALYRSAAANNSTVTTVHGPLSQVSNTNDPYTADQTLKGPGKYFTGADSGNGIIFEYDTRASAPYRLSGGVYLPIRPNPYRPAEPLPITPHLPVAPGLLYLGERPVQMQ